MTVACWRQALWQRLVLRLERALLDTFVYKTTKLLPVGVAFYKLAKPIVGGEVSNTAILDFTLTSTTLQTAALMMLLPVSSANAVQSRVR